MQCWSRANQSSSASDLKEANLEEHIRQLCSPRKPAARAKMRKHYPTKPLTWPRTRKQVRRVLGPIRTRMQAQPVALRVEFTGHGTAAQSLPTPGLANPTLHRHVNEPGGWSTHSVFGAVQVCVPARHSSMSAGNGFRAGNEQRALDILSLPRQPMACARDGGPTSTSPPTLKDHTPAQPPTQPSTVHVIAPV
jgi:hypothetical protein